MQRAAALALVALIVAGGAAHVASAQQPDLTQEHWYHSYATLTLDVQAWEDDYPEVVRLVETHKADLLEELRAAPRLQNLCAE